MKNKKAILAGALMVPALALTGGIAYASSTTTPSHHAPARPAVTATVQHPVGQTRHDWCDWRGHGYGHQPQPAHQHAYRHHNYRHHNGYQHRNGYGNWASQGSGYSGGQGNRGYGYQGNGYQGGWGNGSGSHWGNGGCCGHGW